FSLITKDENLRNFFVEYTEKLVFNADFLSEDSFKRLTYLWFIIPKEVFNRQLRQHLDPEVIETVATLKSNEDFIAEKLIANDILKRDIEVIQKSLEDQKSEYNFVGLSNGFRTLREQKKKELNWQNGAYYILMSIIILLIISKSVWSANYLVSNSFDS